VLEAAFLLENNCSSGTKRHAADLARFYNHRIMCREEECKQRSIGIDMTKETAYMERKRKPWPRRI
jgi:phage anti-repressor protein